MKEICELCNRWNKTSLTDAISNSVVPHKACATPYDSTHSSVKCKRFNDMIKHGFDLYRS